VPQTAPDASAAAAPADEKKPTPSSNPVGEKTKREAEKLYLAGARAVERNDLEAALAAFSKAVQLNPQNPDYTAAEQLARANLVTQLIEQADKAQTLGHAEEARSKLVEAAGLAPDNPSVLQHLDPHIDLGSDLGPQASDDEAKGVALSPGVTLMPDAARHSFHIHGTGQELLKQVLGAYGISPSVDPSVVTKRSNFDGDDLTYADAANLLQMSTDSFFVPLDPKRVLVAKDSKENRTRFERQVVETVYMPGLTSTELTDMSNIARTLFDAQQSSVQAANNTLTVRAPQVRLTALNRTLADLLDGRSQVDLEVRLIEIDTSKTTNIGVQLPQQLTAFNAESEVQNIINSNQSLVQQVISSGLAPAGDLAAIVAVLLASGQVTDPLLSGGYATFGNGLTLTGISVPSVTANLALNSSNTRMLEDVHLRLQDQVEGDVKVGEKYPIETSSYSGLATSSISIPGVSSAGLSSELAALGLGGAAGTQTPVPQVQYQDIGLELKVTPHILRSNDVGMTFDLKLQALAGTTVNDIPELTNREFQAVTSAKAGQSAVFVSDLTKQETRAVSGVPGLSQLPGFQSTTDDTRDVQKNTLIIIITPQIVRHEHTELAGPAVMLTPHE
jgi:Flp pilus assembly secretin CpaC